jgi:uncharacterized protein (TIGR03382 family)
VVGNIARTVDVTLTPGPLASIAVTPASPAVQVTQTQTFTATGKDAFSNTVPVTVSWSAADGGTIDGMSGLFTAGTLAGTFTGVVSATGGGKTGTASVIVTPGAPVALSVSPMMATVPGGGMQQFTASAADTYGNGVHVDPQWSVVAGGGTIDPLSGLFTAAMTAGSFPNTIQAVVSPLMATASVTVTAGAPASIVLMPTSAHTAVQGTVMMTATVKDAAGNVLNVTPSWSVVNGGGSITGAGVFTAGTKSGTFAHTIQASAGTVMGSVDAIVDPGPAAAVQVSPAMVTLAAGAMQAFTADAGDAFGNPVVTAPAWSMADSHAGTVNPTSGLFLAGTTAGTYAGAVVASVGTAQGSATVTVLAATPARVQVSPMSAQLAAGGTQTFTAKVYDSNDQELATTPTWTADASCGSITATGDFTAGTGAGTFTDCVTATAAGVAGHATVIVGPPPPSTVPSVIGCSCGEVPAWPLMLLAGLALRSRRRPTLSRR